jgi:hypothetical protein
MSLYGLSQGQLYLLYQRVIFVEAYVVILSNFVTYPTLFLGAVYEELGTRLIS